MEFLLVQALTGPLQSVCFVQESGLEYHIFSKSALRTSVCPRCNAISSHLHATYRRVIQTVPLHRKFTCIHSTAYKYDCMNPSCPQKVFMESLSFAAVSQVRSESLTALILVLTFFLSDDGVSRVLGAAGARISNDTVCRVRRALKPLSMKRQLSGLPARALWAEELARWIRCGKKLRLNSSRQLADYADAVCRAIPECLLCRKGAMADTFLEKLTPLFLF